MAAATKVVESSEIVEDVKDIVEDSVELVEDSASWIASNPKVLVFGAILAGVAAGSAATYLAVSKRLRSKIQAEADAQIEDVKSRYALLNKEGEHGDLEALAAKYPDQEEVLEERETASKIVEMHGYSGKGQTAYHKVEPAEEAAEEVIPLAQTIIEETQPRDRNVFESDDPTTYFDFDEELKRRAEKPNSPHVITRDEFNENETDYAQSQLTYYDGDDVLADEQDSPIDNKDSTVGEENLLRFGHGSGDPKVVFIRNPKLEVDFEVVHSDGKFAKEVLGFDDGERELQHADRRIRKFRVVDD